MPPQFRFFCLVLLTTISQGFAQEGSFATFLKGFTPKKLPTEIVWDTSRVFENAQRLRPEEVKAYLQKVTTPQGFQPNYYDTFLEPYGPEKLENGKTLEARTEAYKDVLLQKTANYVLFLICIRFVERGLEYMEGEQYLLYSFTPEGKALSVLPIAQRVQFDFQYNTVQTKISQDGKLESLVLVFAPAGNEKIEKKFEVLESGEIILSRD